jgi:hypothetical protein
LKKSEDTAKRITSVGSRTNGCRTRFFQAIKAQFPSLETLGFHQGRRSKVVTCISELFSSSPILKFRNPIKNSGMHASLPISIYTSGKKNSSHLHFM